MVVNQTYMVHNTGGKPNIAHNTGGKPNIEHETGGKPNIEHNNIVMNQIFVIF